MKTLLLSERGETGPSIIIMLIIFTAITVLYEIYVSPSYTPHSYVGRIAQFTPTSLVINIKESDEIRVGNITNIRDFAETLSRVRDQNVMVVLTLRERKRQIPKEVTFRIYNVEILYY